MKDIVLTIRFRAPDDIVGDDLFPCPKVQKALVFELERLSRCHGLEVRWPFESRFDDEDFGPGKILPNKLEPVAVTNPLADAIDRFTRAWVETAYLARTDEGLPGSVNLEERYFDVLRGLFPERYVRQPAEPGKERGEK